MKILIKRAVYVIAVLLLSSMYAVGRNTYMFEAIYLTPKDGANQQLEAVTDSFVVVDDIDGGFSLHRRLAPAG